MVLRTHGKEPFKKPATNTAKQLVAYGILDNFSREHRYCEPNKEFIGGCPFYFKGHTFKVEYFSGCMKPYLLQLTGIEELGTDDRGILRGTINGKERVIRDFDLKFKKRIRNKAEVLELIDWE